MSFYLKKNMPQKHVCPCKVLEKSMPQTIDSSSKNDMYIMGFPTAHRLRHTVCGTRRQPRHKLPPWPSILRCPVAGHTRLVTSATVGKWVENQSSSTSMINATHHGRLQDNSWWAGVSIASYLLRGTWGSPPGWRGKPFWAKQRADLKLNGSKPGVTKREK